VYTLLLRESHLDNKDEKFLEGKGSIGYQQRVANERLHHGRTAKANEVEGEVRRFVPTIAAFQYAMKVYEPFLKERMPHLDLDVHVIERQARSRRPLHLLSLGCGTGDAEIRLARQTSGMLRVTLLDLNPDLMEAARRAAATEGLPLQVKTADVNDAEIEPDCYDFIVCRASLHHFMRLEHALEQVNRGLASQGEFLVSGEWIGRRGLQMYPETERLAQSIFDKLPERLRLDAYTGEVDSVVPNIDHSVNSFEAIRSEEILPLLLDRLRPVEYVAYDGLVTPLLDFRYGPNYDMGDEEDRALAALITLMDVELIRSRVLKPTALTGIFNKR
jgi:SAM-dependent methyltransferase